MLWSGQLWYLLVSFGSYCFEIVTLQKQKKQKNKFSPFPNKQLPVKFFSIIGENHAICTGKSDPKELGNVTLTNE